MSAKGGITEGKSHKEGGIPMVVKSTGQQVELEGGEGVINKRNMASKKTFEFEGKEKTICEIASEINSADGNGVQIDCDNVTGKKYKYNKGGKILNEEQEQSFKEWMEDGNVHKFEDGYSTQDAQWSNRLKGLDELRKYFKKEFLSDSYEGGGEVNNLYVHKYNPNITLEVIEYTNRGVKGLQRNPKSLSKKEKKEGIIVNYSDSEFKELFEKKYEGGGSINVETYDYNQLIGKYVNIYSMGVELPSEHRIEGVMFSSPQFRYRDLTLKFDRGIAPINIEDIPKFLNNDIVFVNDNKEDFGVQLIPNQFAKGGKTNNMKLEDYETASMSMGGYEDGAIDANPTEFAEGGKILKEISTHKAVKKDDKIYIYIKGMPIRNEDDRVLEEKYPDWYKDELIMTIPSENEDNLFDIFESFEENNRVNRAEFSFAKGGVVEFVDTKRTDKNYYFLRFEDAIGSFAWIYKGKYNEGILYPLDDFDKEYYSHIALKSGEKLYRYATERMSSLDKYAVKPFNSVRYLIKFNLDKGLIYFMSEENDPNDDKNIQFDTRGTKADYIVIDKERFAEGGGVGDNYYRISISENDKYIGEYPHSIENIIDAKTIFVQLANQYKRPQYLISVYRRPTSSNGYEKINVNEWYDYVEGFANGGDVRDMSWYQDFKKQELKRGTEHEMEHIDTIKKFKKEGVSDKEVAKAIAKDHLDEDENYYIELEKMEGSSKKLSDAIKEFEKHRGHRKNAYKFKLGGFMGEEREIVHVVFNDDVKLVVRKQNGKYITESIFPKDSVFKFTFRHNDGKNTTLEFANTGSYVIVPNEKIKVVGFNEQKFGNGGSVKPYQSLPINENDKQIMTLLTRIEDPSSFTSSQKQKLSTFKGTNVVNELSSSLIQKIYGLLFQYHNVEHPIKQLFLSNVGAGNIVSYAPNYIHKLMIDFDERNRFVSVEKEINSIVNISKKYILFSEEEIRNMDAIIHVYPETNAPYEQLNYLLYKTDKPSIALGVCEFTSKDKLDAFKVKVVTNQSAFAQNQMMMYQEGTKYMVINEGITDEGSYTLIYILKKMS